MSLLAKLFGTTAANAKNNQLVCVKQLAHQINKTFFLLLDSNQIHVGIIKNERTSIISKKITT